MTMDQNKIKPRLVDYHLHTTVTADWRMNESDACEQAIALGIGEIAFTNHIMLNQPGHIISPGIFINHWERIQECMLRFPALQIRLGIEMDYYPDREFDIAQTIQFYQGLIGRPLDIVLGSVHEIRGSFFSNKIHAVNFFKDCDIVAVYTAYFDLAAQAARSRLFDVIAHPDLIKKYTYELTPFVAFEIYKGPVDTFINALIDNGVGIEVNTKGLTRPIHEMYPSLEFLSHYLACARASGTEPVITVGSDAHKLDGIGKGIAQVFSVLKELQVSHLSGFKQRRKYSIEI